MFNFDYSDRIENYLRKNNIVNKVDTFDDLLTVSSKYPALYQIMDILHTIVLFPNGEVFNCNPRDYFLSITSPLKVATYGIMNTQVEPSTSEYEKYWNEHQMETNQDTVAVPTERNCGLWSTYYLWWRINSRGGIFPSSLLDLELWITMVCEKYLDNYIDLFY